MSKSIWIVNEHLTSPDLSESGHSRHYTLGLEFLKNGYDVSLITSSFSHNPKRKVKLNGCIRVMDGKIRTMIIKGFQHEKSSSPIRIINWFVFSLLFFFAPFTRLPRPEIIILSSTPMLPIYGVLFFKKLYPKCKFIFETRDLWPLTPKSLGNYSDDSMFIRFLSHLERKCYANADYIVSVLKNSDQHIQHILGHRDFCFKWISNGIDVNGFKKNRKKKDWKSLRQRIPKDALIVGYAGTIGKANAMEYIVTCFDRHFRNSKYYLVLLGEGGEKEDLQKMAGNNDNIIFHDAVKREYLMSFYEECDLLYLSWRDVDLYRFGVSANKLFEYMYSKTPILMSSNIPDNIIEQAKCGIIARPEDPEDIQQKIMEFEIFPRHKKLEMGENGYDFVVANLTYEKLAEDYIGIFSVLGSRTLER